MQGLMQDWPLLCHRIIDHAAINAGEQPVISRSIEGPMHTTNYAEIRKRALRVAQRLERDGLRLGDRVATLAWNTWRHLETWYGILGIGAVYHTINPRLFTNQIAWIINHAEDRVIMTDVTFLPILEKIADRIPTIERTIVYCDAAHMPATSLRNAVPYEDWLAEADGDFAWKSFDENTAAGMCYTSGTTGNPKGVLYSHRSNVLHAMTASRPDMIGLSGRDIAMPVVPLFHANGWAIGFAAPMAGATLILPGQKLDGPSIYQLLNDYKVTLHGGRADGLVGTAARPRKDWRQAALFAPGCNRRLGLSTRYDFNIPRRLRRRSHPRLGHDRDESAWHHLFAQGRICRPQRRRAS